mmetsp:Transcript_34896/g.73387  ORF Transcript_34896/g.73387 Transcript_34896/m.73387 type:complete len:121 (-) Transcript_34896:620-982(-)
MPTASTERPPPLSWPPSLKSLFDWHAYNLQTDPVFAHWSAAAAATLFGCVLAAGRGAVFAATCAPAERAAGFAFATRGAAPLYVVPFVLGSQLDCYETQWELARRGTRRTDLSHSAVDLG